MQFIDSYAARAERKVAFEAVACLCPPCYTCGRIIPAIVAALSLVGYFYLDHRCNNN